MTDREQLALWKSLALKHRRFGTPVHYVEFSAAIALLDRLLTEREAQLPVAPLAGREWYGVSQAEEEMERIQSENERMKAVLDSLPEASAIGPVAAQKAERFTARHPSAYNLFVAEQSKAGKTLKEIGALWRAQKGGT